MRAMLTSTCLALALASCSDGGNPVPKTSETAAPDAVASAASDAASHPAPDPAPSPTASTGGRPFADTLPGPTDKDPQSLLAYWKGAVESGDIAAANKAWRAGSTPTTMPQGTGAATVSFGAGEQDGAAGSLYFTVPVAVTVVGPDGEPIPTTGTLTARRVNDGDGASAEQLSWRIVSIDWN